MKKFFIIGVIISSVFSFTSCSTDDIKEGNVVKFEYNNHKYIRFEYSRGYGKTWSVVHDPDCKCYNVNK